MERRTFLAGTATFVVGGVSGWLGNEQFTDGDSVTVDCECPSSSEQGNYDATLIEVIDGDTIDLRIAMGLNTQREIRVRIADIDTAEFDENESLAREQTTFVRDLLTDAERLVFRSTGERGGFGRWLGDINADGVWLSEAVLDEWPNATYDGT